MSTEDSLVQQRRVKLGKLRELGVDPFGGRFGDCRSVADVRAVADRLNLADGEHDQSQQVRLAGRIVLQRVMGNLAFVTLRDGTADIQLGFSKREVKEYWPVVKALDLGDIIGVDGWLGKTKTGEITVWATSLKLLCKALHPPPEKWHGLTDVELRYRHRYVDLFSNPAVRNVFKARSLILQAVREYLVKHGYLEVEDSGASAHLRRRGRPALHDAPQHPGHRVVSENQPRTVSQKTSGGRDWIGFSSFPETSATRG